MLVSKDAEGMMIESRRAEVRRPLKAVKPMTQQGQWVCCGPDRAFAYKIEAGRVIPFESTPNGWNLTVELGVPNDANSKLQEVMDIMMTEKRLEIEHVRGLHHAIKQMWTGRKDVSSFWVAGHGPVRPHERSLEPLTTQERPVQSDHKSNQ